MKQLITLFLIVYGFSTVLGQAANDNCTTAVFIDLPTPALCPSSERVEVEIEDANINATPSSPVIRIDDNQTNSSLQNAVADIWYTFTATSNRLNITLTGEALEQPTLVLFQGSDCGGKWPVALKREAATATQLAVATEPGQEYYLLAAGADVNAQGDFTLRLEAFNACSTCGNRRGLITATPAPVNGTYEAGQTVSFCYTPTLWDPGFALEWLHAVELDFGPGWDLSSLQTSAPASCTEDMGDWGYYNSWESCNTGAAFGPGFAFDARQGLLCGSATPMDGDPGNNFGDGPCNGLEPAPVPLAFCWTVQVREDFNSSQARSLNLQARPLGDGYSGSWMPFDCEGESTSRFLATATPEPLLLPTFTVLERACPSSCNGSITLNGGNAQNYRLYDENGSMLYESTSSITNDTLTNLCAGLYELQIEGNGSSQTVPLELPARPLPEGQTGYIAPCSAAGSFQLIGLVSPPSPDASFYWEGPNGYSATQASPTAADEGNYSLYIETNGCDMAPIPLAVSHRLPEVQSRATEGSVLFEWNAHPQDTAYEVTVLSGQTGSFIEDRVFQVAGLSETETVEIELRALSTGPCAVKTVEASATTLSCELPSVVPDTIICEGQELELSVDAPDNAIVSWTPAANLDCSNCATTLAAPEQSTTYEVEVNLPGGCSSTQEVQVWVGELPEAVLPDSSLRFCPGEPFEFCLPDDNNYLWISPVGFIRTGNCLSYPYTNERVAGDYLIRVQRQDGCRFFEELSLEINPACNNNNFDSSSPASFAIDGSTAEYTQLFPNPASDVFQLQTDGKLLTQVTIYSTAGQMIQQWQSPDPGQSYNIRQLESGVYVVQLDFPGGDREQRRLVVSQ